MENRRHWRTAHPLEEQQLSRKRDNFLPTTSYQIKGESVEGTNLHMLLDLQVIIRIRNLKNLALHYRLLEPQKEASPQSSVVSQSESENSNCLDRTSDDSKSYQLHETETVASSQFSVVSQSESENFACLDRTSDASQSSRYLTIEKDVVNTLFTAQVQSYLNKLSAEAAVEHSSISVDKCYDSEIVCTCCLKKGSLAALRHCTGCKCSSYCSKYCQRSDWPSHKQLCKSIQSQNPQN